MLLKMRNLTQDNLAGSNSKSKDIVKDTCRRSSGFKWQARDQLKSFFDPLSAQLFLFR